MAPRLRIAFFGSSLLSAYWNGAATYYRGLIRALHEHGHRITFYEPEAFERQKHCDMPAPAYAYSVIYPAHEAGVRAALASAREADVVVKASGVGVFDTLLEQEVLGLQSARTRVVFWDVDAPATLERVQQRPDDPFRQCIPEYDLILTYGGGAPVVQAYLALGARACVPIYHALDPATHHPVAPKPRFSASLGFLGNRLPDREARVHTFFFEPARALPERHFLLGGSGWEGLCPVSGREGRGGPKPTQSRQQHVPQLPNVTYLGHVYTWAHNAFNCTPLAVLNITRESMARYGFSPPTRIFEAAGAAACLITDAWDGLELFLDPGRECLVARNGVEVMHHLQTLTSERARLLGQAARQRVLAQHTYAHRAAQVEELLYATCHTPGGITHEYAMS
jgi:spore maturation protein CgeB